MPADDSSAVTDFYDRLAARYDLLATAPVVRGWRELAAEALDLDPGDTVVEMGCGTGANVPALREQVGPEGRVVGVDLTAAVLDRARAHLGPDGLLVLEVGNSAGALLERRPELVLTWPELEQGGVGVALIEAATLPDAVD